MKKHRRLVLTLRDLQDHLHLQTPTEEIVITARILNSRIRIGVEAPDSVVITRSTIKKETPDG